MHEPKASGIDTLGGWIIRQQSGDACVLANVLA
jgi:hypothetical protein